MSIINLLPDDYVRTRTRGRANRLCVALFAVVMAAVIGAEIVSARSSRHTRQVRDQVNASYAEAAKLIDQMQQLQQQKAALIAKAERAASLQERVPRSYILGVLTNACPRGASLSCIELDTTPDGQDGKPSKFDVVSKQQAGKPSSLHVKLVVTGYASTDVDVARYIASLAKSPLLTSVDLVYSEQRDAQKAPLREFQIRLEVVPGVDVIDIIQKTPEAAPAKPNALADRGGER